MGVPAFFRWLVKKYPKILHDVVENYEVVDGVEIPQDLTLPNPNGIEFDNLYLDMNGIIHPCSHPESGPQPQCEEDVMVAIFNYIDRIFSMVRPRRVLFMAIDGVAPRAKMNQQRSRRFKAIKEREEAAEKEKKIREETGQPAPEEKKWDFDSNCITPGTEFMDKVAKSLRYYIQERQNTDPAWQEITVILSDATVPGEGEHKIMEFIRLQRTLEGHDPNTHHVLYGLDADLIMLGLATHEPHFFILRETVDLGISNNCYTCGQPGHRASECKGVAKEKQGETDSKEVIRKPFQFLHVSILREYLDFDLKPFAELPFPYDTERALDDFVFLCFFVGNDFLPHLPTLAIREGAIDLLTDQYRQLLPSLGGYLTEAGEVNLSRVAILLEEVGKLEERILVSRKARIERYRNNRRRRERQEKEREARLKGQLAQNPYSAFREQNSHGRDRRKRRKIENENVQAAQQLKDELFSGDKKKEPEKKEEKAADPENDDPPDNVRLGEKGWKERYYKHKFSADVNDEEFKKSIAKSYAEGLVWVLRYYYQGCCSWGWYYPFHYSSFAEDMYGMPRERIDLEKGEPFKPFEQLMGVLPAKSGWCLPPGCQELMTNPDSEIIDFYPVDFPLDMNGKRYTWQAVALLPFIDEERLKKAMEGLEYDFTSEEKRRNSLGHTVLFVHKKNVMAPKIESLCEEEALGEKGNERTGLVLDVKTDLIGGTIYYSEESTQIGDTVTSPIETCKPIENNQVYSAIYEFPKVEEGHVFSTKILPGCVMPPTQLTPEDLPNSRKRAFTINMPAADRTVRHHIGGGRRGDTRPSRGYSNQHYRPYQQRPPQGWGHRNDRKGNRRDDDRYGGSYNNRDNRNRQFHNQRYSQQQSYGRDGRDQRGHPGQYQQQNMQPQQMMQNQPMPYRGNVQPPQMMQNQPMQYGGNMQPPQMMQNQPMQYGGNMQPPQMMQNQPMQYGGNMQPPQMMQNQPFHHRNPTQPPAQNPYSAQDTMRLLNQLQHLVGMQNASSNQPPQ